MKNLKNKMIGIVIIGLLLTRESIPGGAMVLTIGGFGLALYYLKK
jgi:hypothetical protein|tara:strand:- start:109 stop:243 length:135 start_codon:yes stop_codon:yes gene_type:complete